MSSKSSVIEQLTTLNQIAETLNRSVDVRSALGASLERLVELMGLETGWIFLHDPASQERWAGRGYVLAAYHNLPPGLALDEKEVWETGCDCQGLCNRGRLERAYNEVRCSRLASASGDRRGLAVHASTPLLSNERVLGILNVAGPEWASFSETALALLTNAGIQMGIALERARLFDMLQDRRIQEQAALLDLSNQLLSRLDLDDMIDYVVDEARRLLQVDACALLLPDREPGYLNFQAASGWQVDPVAKQRRIPANEQSGPGQVMLTQQPLLVEDLEQGQAPPWSAKWLEQEGFRGHVVVPLVTGGHSVGVLVINTRQPHLLDEDRVRFLRLMANQAAIAIEKARLHQEEIRQQRLDKELALAQRIQLNLLPEACPVLPGWELAAFYRTARQVGGDFYDFFELPSRSNQLGLVIADVAGKGVPAALLMALSRTMLRTSAYGDSSPAAALLRTNELILRDNDAVRRFVSVFYGALNCRSGQLLYANGGHNAPLWLPSGAQTCRELVAQGAVLGAFESIDLEERQIELGPGDILVFYTDGVTEAMNGHRQMFGEERLKQVITANRTASPPQLLQAVVDAVRAFTGDTPQSDDLTLVVLRRQEP